MFKTISMNKNVKIENSNTHLLQLTKIKFDLHYVFDNVMAKRIVVSKIFTSGLVSYKVYLQSAYGITTVQSPFVSSQPLKDGHYF